MARIDLLTEVTPHEVKPGVEGKIFLVHGEKKSGKTTFATSFPDALLLATEPGFNMLPGVHAVMVNSWIEMRDYVKQLKKDELKAKYKTIVIDTVSIAWEMCANFIKTQKGIEDLNDLGWGKGQKLAGAEFSNAVNEIAKQGYTVVMIGHSVRKDLETLIGQKIAQTVTINLDNKPKEFVTALADLTIFSCIERDANGINTPVAYLRSGVYEGIKIEDAGGRYKKLPIKIPFTYDAFINAIKEADQALEADGHGLTGKTTIMEEQANTIDMGKITKSWAQVNTEVNDALQKLSERMNNGEAELRKTVLDIIESYLGQGKKISEATEAQQSLVEAALADLLEL